MATKLGLATISGLFAKAYRRGIAKDSYDIWLYTFRNISDEDLEAAALHLIGDREKWKSGQVAPDEITRALRDMGISIYHCKEDAAFANSPLVKALTQEAQGKPISMAEFRKTNEEGGEAIETYLGGNDASA
ncbi:unnamed protein product [marine sediment metagenome]|uniref:Uncharacterized protein n=1 Tax=marine sediment metagenome TaxID=412755 RepID=X0X9D7_9ZZZZ